MKAVKHGLVEFGIHCIIAMARMTYVLMKLFPVRHKVVFLSRQGEDTPLDFQLIIDELHLRDPDIQVKVLCRKLDQGFWALIRYYPHFVAQAYHLATSKVAILDSYSVSACVLKHKKSLKVIQLWHGLGAFKKFGYSVHDVAEGQRGPTPLDARRMAELMHQHENYDVVIASSQHHVPHYAQAFHIDPEKIMVASLPRVDLLCDPHSVAEMRTRLEAAYPALIGKKNIIFSPTFRHLGSMEAPIRALADEVDYTNYNLIIRLHPLTELSYEDPRTLKIDDFSTLEILSACDYMITDYSAVTFEMFLLGKPVFFYQFDAESYESERGFYTPPSEFPGGRYAQAQGVLRSIEADEYDLDAISTFIDREIEFQSGNTARLVSLIEEFCQ
ncbi:MAG: CDP-glycerol glycerophosphotransferase family protein [Propionibacteriaceae bacterium]|nr:CDP-glycerol glycerophosphotransferase family protein [Propionibacteriaceae bacterium]